MKKRPVPILKQIPYSALIIASLVLGLAPFLPQPHVVEKIGMLLDGELRRGIDIFDLIFHLAPVALLVLKLATEGVSMPRPVD